MSRLSSTVLVLILAFAVTWAFALAPDEVVFDKSVGNWVVDRFAGNTKAGGVFYQGTAREVGGLQRPSLIVETPNAVYLASAENGADNPNLYRIQGGMLRLVMEREGLIEGPLELSRGGFPIWNEYDKTLYLTGPYCIRKIIISQDGSRKVKVVAGIPNVAGTTDGPALKATLQKPRGLAAAQDGVIYWLETKALRKFANGMVSTVPLTRPETPGWLWNLGPGGGLSAGEDANTLYISNYYDTTHGYSILKIDLTKNEVHRVIGVKAKDPNHGHETDGPATESAAFRGGARGIYHPGYKAVLLAGADSVRYRWWKLEGDNWVRTFFGKLRPDTEAKPFRIKEVNSIGMEGEQFRIGSTRITSFIGTGKNGGVYLGNFGDRSGVWRAYDKTVGIPVVPSSPSSVHSDKGSRINAILVGPDGQPLNASVEISSSATGVQARPRVAYYNGTFLVVWHDLRNGSDFDVLGVRIAQDGTVLDASPLLVGTGPRTQTMPDVAADENGFMVVWGGYRQDDIFPHVFAARVDADGTVGLATAIASGASPRITWSPLEKKHFVLYSSANDNNLGPTINWLIMDSRKNVAPQPRYPWVYGGGGNPNHYSVCSIPQRSKGWTFVTDYQSGNGWNRSIGAQRAINITPDGVLAADSPTAETGTYIENYVRPQKPGGGAANWLDYHYDLEKEWPYGANAAAPDGDYCVAIWSRQHIGGMTGISLYNSDLYASRINRWDPMETNPVRVAASTASERDPSLAGNGKGNLVVVYEKLDGGTSQIVTRPLTVTDQITVGNEVVIMGESGVRRGFPDIEYGGENSDVFMVVWQEGWYGVSDILSSAGTSSPLRYNGQPAGSLAAGTSQTTLSLSTNKDATCKYDTSPDVSFQGMANTFAETGQTTHTQTITDLADGMTYRYYTKCRDTSDHANNHDYALFFSVSSPADTVPAPVDSSLPVEDPVEITPPQSQLIQDGGLTPEQVSIFLPGTFQVSTTATLRYKKAGDPNWITGHPLFRIRPEFAARGMTIDSGFAWTIFGLTPGTAYDVEVTTHDGDVNTVHTAVMSTRALPSPAGSATKNIAVGSTAAQIQSIFNSAVPGDVIQFADGTHFVDNLRLSRNGTTTKPITIRGQSRLGTILEDRSGKILNLDTCSNVIIENMTMQGSGVDAGVRPASTGIFFWGGYKGSKIKENVTIRNVTISGVDRGIDVNTEIKQMLVYDNELIGNNSWGQDSYAYGGSGTPGSGDGTPDVDQNLFWNDDGIRITGQGNAAFNNTISGFGDALAVENGYKSTGVHFFRNDIKMTGDDGIEGDYASRNVTFYDNRVQNAMTLVSLDPVWGGPFIAARNIGINIGRQAYKLNNTNTGMYFYNNTVVRTTNPDKNSWAWAQPNNGPLRAWGYQNNILIYQGEGDGLLAMEPSVQDPIDFSHNSWYPDGRVWWTKSGGSYSNLSTAYSSLPQTMPVFSGISKRHEADNISKANPFVTNIVLGETHHIQIKTPYVPTLAAGSSPKNSGTPITGITDGFSGAAPDRGAIISGIQTPAWGDRSSF